MFITRVKSVIEGEGFFSVGGQANFLEVIAEISNGMIYRFILLKEKHPTVRIFSSYPIVSEKFGSMPIERERELVGSYRLSEEVHKEIERELLIDNKVKLKALFLKETNVLIKEKEEKKSFIQKIKSLLKKKK